MWNIDAQNALTQTHYCKFFFHTIGEIDDDVIEFSQQTTTDRSNVTHHTETVDVCIGATTYLAVLHLEMSIEALNKIKI